MEEIRRDDGELCGFVHRDGDRWVAANVFRAPLATVASRPEAVEVVGREGLASLADHWLLVRPDGSSEIVAIIEASPASVTVALGYYAMPGVPRLTIDAAQLDTGDYRLTRA